MTHSIPISNRKHALPIVLACCAVGVLTVIALTGLGDRTANLRQLAEQHQRLQIALLERETEQSAARNLEQRIQPLPPEVPAQQDANALLQTFWAETGHPPPLEFRLERPEASLGIARLSQLTFSARLMVNDDQIDSFLQPLEARRDQLTITDLSLRPPRSMAVHPGQIEVQLRGQLLIRRSEARR